MRVLMRMFPIAAVVAAAAALYAARRPTDPVELKVDRLHVERRPAVAAGGDCATDELRMAALEAVLQMDADRAMPILLKVLERRDECSVELRSKAVFLVSQQESPEVTDVLVRVVREDPAFEVRKQGVFWLSQVDDERAVPALEWVLAEVENQELQKQAIFALSQHSSVRSEQILRDYAARDAAPLELRQDAIFWLGQEGSQESQEFLRELFSTVANQELKEKIVFAISQRGSAESGEWLLTVVNDAGQPVEIRKNALFWLGQEFDADLLDLQGFYANTESRELKEQVLFVLSQREEGSAVEQLIDIARSETDTELRKKALFWLGQSDDSRAVEFLLEVIEK